MKQLVFLILFFPAFLFSQEKTDERALKLIRANNYKEALPLFLKLQQKDSKNMLWNYYTGYSYLYSGYDGISKSVTYLERAAASKKATADQHLLLAQAYLINHQPDKALASIKKYESLSSPSSYIKRFITYCENQKELMKRPVNVSFENAGININSEFDDYTPFISDNESFLIFNSKREPEAKKLEDGSMMSDVFISTDHLGKWGKAERIGNVINEPERQEEVVGVSADGKTIAYRFFTDSLSGNLLVGPKEGSEFFPPQQLEGAINTPMNEVAATLAPDGKTIYFVSDRKDGNGGYDIFRVTRMPNGDWSSAMNLGSNVNSEEDENYPFLSADGKKLYFSSKGHNSIGGYDIFLSLWNDSLNQWDKAVNLGYPVNTGADNISFCASETGRYGYLSAQRADSYGDLDIYRVVFNDVEPKKTLLKGFVSTTSGDKMDSKVKIEVFNPSEKLIGSYIPNQYTGKYIMILEPGDYKVQVRAEGYKPFDTVLKVYEKSGFEVEKINEIYLLEKL